jgi:hypothetical protein
MNQKIWKLGTITVVILILGYLITSFFSNTFNNNLAPKAKTSADKETLRRITEEAESYFDEFGHYGVLQEGEVGTTTCQTQGTFLSRQAVIDILNRYDKSQCIYQIDQNGSNRVNSWSLAVKEGGGIVCVDSSGASQKLNSFPQSASCQ